jgi:ABC-type lipoprotein export system ATPase subunit
MIELREVSKVYDLGKYKVTAVDNVTMHVGERDFVLVAGRSGCGKTTLLSLIAGLTRPTSGSVRFNDIDIWTLPDKAMSSMRNQKIGFIFQFPSLIPTLNVSENVKMAASFNPVNYDVDGRVKDLLDMVGMSEKDKAYPNQLSGGQQKRVSIARALMNSPMLVLADEPTGDLDEETEKEIMMIFKELNQNQSAIVLVSHNPDIVTFATRRYQMLNGSLTER